MKSKSFSFLVAVLLAAAAAFSQNSSSSSQPVLDVSAMDKSVDPCVDFYTYSCGGWMKKNPIPPDQSSWSTYGKLQDENLAQLRAILEEAAKANAGKGSVTPVTQKIGDYYASCMDEPAIEKLGAKPLAPDLERIAALKSKQDIAEYLTTGQFPPALYGGGVLFTFRSDQDYKDSEQVIAEADQGGLGLPDRDYYFKDDAKSQELRKAYLAHVQKMFELLGDKPGDAAAEAATVMRLETALAQGHMTRVERRDPPKLYHKMQVAELENLAPAFPLGNVLREDWLEPAELAQRGRARVLPHHECGDREREPGGLEDVSALARGAQCRHVPVVGVRHRGFQFLQQDAAWTGAAAAALEALFDRRGQRPGRGAGPGLCGPAFRPRGQAGSAQGGERDRSRHARRYQDAALDGGGDAATGAREARGHRQQDRLSRQVARLQRARNRARRRDRQRPAGGVVRVPALARQDRQTGGPQRVGHDAAHGQRLLRSRRKTTSTFRRGSCSRRCSARSRMRRRITATPAPPWATN